MDKEVIGIFAGIFTAASLVPQSIKSLREKKVEVSPVMFILLLGGNGLWVWYGIKLDDLPIINHECLCLHNGCADALPEIFLRK